MCPMWVMFLIFCIILYTLKYSNVKICDISLGIILSVIVVSYYVYMNNTKENFTSDRKIKVYNFNTKWCGWSKKFQPEWNKFEKMINSLDNKDEYEVKDIKCDNIENDAKLKALTKKYKVEGYPYVVIENNEGQMPYNGERTAEALYNQVQDL
jgi:thiol-disulfide isomerase/thioredoxin